MLLLWRRRRGFDLGREDVARRRSRRLLPSLLMLRAQLVLQVLRVLRLVLMRRLLVVQLRLGPLRAALGRGGARRRA